VTTGVHVAVFLPTASTHVRTEPLSVIGHTGGKKNQSDLSSLLKFTVVVMDDAFASFLLQCREMVEIRKTFRGGFE
jgi:hypothetical protein